MNTDMRDAFIIIGCLIFSIVIISAFLANYLGNLFAYRDSPASSPRSLGSFTNNIYNNLTSISFALRSYDAASIIRMHNTTSRVSLVGEANVDILQRPLFKPFVGLDSGESYLTRDFQAYKAAKNQSEIIKPSTSVFVVKPPFEQFTYWPCIIFYLFYSCTTRWYSIYGTIYQPNY